MGPIQKLRQEALANRDALIKHAHDQYKLALKEINAIAVRIRKPSQLEFRASVYKSLGFELPTGECSEMTSVQAAWVVLGEGRPLILRELVIELQVRGHRHQDTLRSVTNAVRTGLYAHPELFRLNRWSKWELMPNAKPGKIKGGRLFKSEKFGGGRWGGR